MDEVLGEDLAKFKPGEILNGRIVGLNKDYVIIDVGLKSEGQVSKTEFDEGADDLTVGDEIEVLLFSSLSSCIAFKTYACTTFSNRARKTAACSFISGAALSLTCTILLQQSCVICSAERPPLTLVTTVGEPTLPAAVNIMQACRQDYRFCSRPACRCIRPTPWPA